MVQEFRNFPINIPSLLKLSSRRGGEEITNHPFSITN
jgi:hypothetical protein